MERHIGDFSLGQEAFPAPDMDDVELVDILRTLGDPIRLHIVQVLADGERHGKDLQQWEVGVQKSTMAHHFKTLRENGITRTIVDGRKHDIQLRREELDEKFPGLIAALLERGARPAAQP